MSDVRREPVWSGVLTRPLAARMPVRWQREALAVIESVATTTQDVGD